MDNRMNIIKEQMSYGNTNYGSVEGNNKKIHLQVFSTPSNKVKTPNAAMSEAQRIMRKFDETDSMVRDYITMRLYYLATGKLLGE